ncbi:MAG: hypothetical protein ACFFFG_06680 [Candidatus Thorarchaeota archaeon]
MNSNRRLYIDNWAVFTAENQVNWHFGDIDQEKLIQVVSFIKALSSLGTEMLDQVIGLIRLRYPRPHPTKAREILIVNLLEKYSIIVSDPLVTTRLMNRIQLNSDPIPPLDDIRSILAGTASLIYSDFYTRDTIQVDNTIIDSIFQEAVQAVTYDKNVTVGNGECSFSALSIEELLFFHALLRDLLEGYIPIISGTSPWGVISSLAGTELYLSHCPPADPALIAAFSGVIVQFSRFLFDATPARLIFGYYPMNAMDFVVTNDNLFLFGSPSVLLKKTGFRKKWRNLPVKIAQDLVPGLKTYLTELCTANQKAQIRDMEFYQVVNQLTGMGARKAQEVYSLS